MFQRVAAALVNERSPIVTSFVWGDTNVPIYRAGGMVCVDAWTVIRSVMYSGACGELYMSEVIF